MNPPFPPPGPKWIGSKQKEWEKKQERNVNRRWEYLVHEFTNTRIWDLNEGLDKLGKQGWELVTMSERDDCDMTFAIFKRPLLLK